MKKIMRRTHSTDFEKSLSACQLCPRQCGVNRLAGETGFCRAGLLPRVALASLHQWEEPCISGVRGSGTVFFAGCNLTCIYCQNQRISQQDFGDLISIERLAEIFWAQQMQGAHNLNLVTPTPYVPQIIAALDLARQSGFALPVVYNTSAYESVETIQALQGWVDIYLPDLKYVSDLLALSLSQVPDYFSHAMNAIGLMQAQVGPAEFDRDGLLIRGLLIRHLALPGQAADSQRVLAAIYEQFGNETWFSLMNQYTPPTDTAMPLELGRRLTDGEYDELIDFALSLGLENGFIQEAGTASEKFIPDFNLDGVTKKGESP
jgi:putative pyruvate formate lyase activating enzyme